MSWVEDTIGDFGRGMGMADLALSEEGLLCLSFESMGTLFLERIENAMLVYLVRDLPPHELGRPGKALELCHYRQGLPFSVNAALSRKDGLVFLARVPENEFSLPILEKMVDLLVLLHKKVSGG